MALNKNFIWGSATASYQVEGAYLEDGKGLNIFDTFCKVHGNIINDDNGDIACDHYHRFREDVALMKKIGLKAYRFSISWSRILPEGTGKVNPAGIKFYNELIDELLKNDIIPFVTLYHWDMPLALDKLGGWRNPMIVQWFANYAKVVAENFSDRVQNFFTINEPQVIVGMGHQFGKHAPGLRLTTPELLEVAHNLLKAHGAAVIALRTFGKQKLNIGYAPCGCMNIPATDSPEDIDAAKRSMFEFNDPSYAPNSISWYNDAIIFGKYPEKEFKMCEPFMPKVTESDMKLISQPIDFLGHNVYWGMTISGKSGKINYVKDPGGFANDPHNWPVTHDCIYWGTKFLYERYNMPVIITENGKSCLDTVSDDGAVHDTERISYIKGYLRGLKKSAEEGTDIRGYFHWSLMDNFEWAYGYKERFGLIYVDYPTQKRILKDSAYYYSDIIKSNGEILND